MRALHCTCAIVALLAIPAVAQTPPVASTTAYTLFLRGVPIGSEDITVSSGADGLTVRSRGTSGPPLSTVLRDVALRYGADGAPRSFELDGFVNGADVALETTVAGGTATTSGSHGARTIANTQPVSADAVMLPSGRCLCGCRRCG